MALLPTRLGLGLAALLAVTAAPAATAAGAPHVAAAPQAGPAPAVAPARADVAARTDERGCTEVAYTRGALRDLVRPLVPERYGLVVFPPPDAPPPPPEVPPRVQLLVNEVVCDVVTTRSDGHRSRERKVTTVIVSADTSTIDGQPSDGVYTLLLATENRVQAAAMERLGWPVTRLARRSGGGSTSLLGGLTQATVSPRGGGWDHDLVAVSLTAFPEPTRSTAVYHRDTASTRLSLCFDNDAAVVDATYFGDLTSTPLAKITFAPPVFRGYNGFIVKGGWRSTLTSGSCPVSGG